MRQQPSKLKRRGERSAPPGARKRPGSRRSRPDGWSPRTRLRSAAPSRRRPPVTTARRGPRCARRAVLSPPHPGDPLRAASSRALPGAPPPAPGIPPDRTCAARCPAGPAGEAPPRPAALAPGAREEPGAAGRGGRPDPARPRGCLGTARGRGGLQSPRAGAGVEAKRRATRKRNSEDF